MRGADSQNGSLFSYVNREKRIPARHPQRDLDAEFTPLDAVDGRTARHSGYAVSQRKCKLVEEPVGWGRTVGPIRKTMLRGLKHVCAHFKLKMAFYNLARLPRFLAA